MTALEHAVADLLECFGANEGTWFKWEWRSHGISSEMEAELTRLWESKYGDSKPTAAHYDRFAAWLEPLRPDLSIRFCSDNHADGFYDTITQSLFTIWWAGYKEGRTA